MGGKVTHCATSPNCIWARAGSNQKYSGSDKRNSNAAVQNATCLIAVSSLKNAMTATPINGSAIRSVNRCGSSLVFKMMSFMWPASEQHVHTQNRDGAQRHCERIMLHLAALQQPEHPAPEIYDARDAVDRRV